MRMHSFRPSTHQYLIDMDQVLSVNQPATARTVNLTPYMPFCISQTAHPLSFQATSSTPISFQPTPSTPLSFQPTPSTWAFPAQCNLRITSTCSLQHHFQTYNMQQQPLQQQALQPQQHLHPSSSIQQQQPQLHPSSSFHSSCPVCISDQGLHRMHPFYLQYARSLLRRIADEQSELERLQQLNLRQQQQSQQHSQMQQQSIQQQQWQQQQQRQNSTQQPPSIHHPHQSAWTASFPSQSFPTTTPSTLHHYTTTTPPSFQMISEDSYNIPPSSNTTSNNNNNNNIESSNNSNNAQRNVANHHQTTQHLTSSQQPNIVSTQHQVNSTQQPQSSAQQMHRFVSMHIVHILQCQQRLQLIRQHLEQQEQHRTQQQHNITTHQHNIQPLSNPSQHSIPQQRPLQQPQQSQIHYQQPQPPPQQPHYQQHFQQQQHLPHSPFHHHRHHPHLFQTLIPEYLTRVSRQPPVVSSIPAPSQTTLQFVLARVGRTPMTQYRMINLYEENTDLENYETLLHITEQMGEVRIRGLSASEINSLPSYRYHNVNHKPHNHHRDNGVKMSGDEGLSSGGKVIEGKEVFQNGGSEISSVEGIELRKDGISEMRNGCGDGEIRMEAGELYVGGKVLGKVVQTEGQVSCVVCLCEFELKQWLKVMPCHHEFHSDCISKWLKENNTCPLCRSDIAERLRKTANMES